MAKTSSRSKFIAPPTWSTLVLVTMAQRTNSAPQSLLQVNARRVGLFLVLALALVLPLALKSPSDLIWFISGTDDSERSIDSTADFAKLVADISKGGHHVIIDVREPEELANSGHIPGAVNIPRTYINITLSCLKVLL